MTERPIPSTAQFQGYIHCRRCMEKKPPKVAAFAWSRLSVGLTPIGLQVWCERCGINVLHVDFEDLALRANTASVGESITLLNPKTPPPCDRCAAGEPHVH